MFTSGALYTNSVLVWIYNNHERIIIRSRKDVKRVMSKAEAHRRPVTIIHYIQTWNVFMADETGSSTQEMGDGENVGEKYMAPVWETP